MKNKHLLQCHGVVFLILLEIALSIYFFPVLPNKMPIHWNMSGVINGYCSRFFGAFMIPLISSIVYGLYCSLPYIDPRKANYEQFNSTFQWLKNLIILFLFCVHFVILLNGVGIHLDILFVIELLISLLFVLMGNVLGRIKCNYFVGIRTPWTLANEEVWKKTHRFSAPLWVGGGILNFLLFLAGAKVYGILFVISVLTIIPTIYSYRSYQMIVQER